MPWPGIRKNSEFHWYNYSTNYVFDGARGDYTEKDAPSPLSAYGRSKLRGEQMVAVNGGRGYIVRTAVIFGPKGESEASKKSFVDIMLDLSQKRDVIQAVSDEVNSLTYAPDLAGGTRRLLAESPATGIYHMTDAGGASWFDLANEIFRITQKRVTVLPCPPLIFRARRCARPKQSW